jgi:hypothetical protein
MLTNIDNSTNMNFSFDDWRDITHDDYNFDGCECECTRYELPCLTPVQACVNGHLKCLQRLSKCIHEGLHTSLLQAAFDDQNLELIKYLIHTLDITIDKDFLFDNLKHIHTHFEIFVLIYHKYLNDSHHEVNWVPLNTIVSGCVSLIGYKRRCELTITELHDFTHYFVTQMIQHQYPMCHRTFRLLIQTRMFDMINYVMETDSIIDCTHLFDDSINFSMFPYLLGDTCEDKQFVEFMLNMYQTKCTTKYKVGEHVNLIEQLYRYCVSLGDIHLLNYFYQKREESTNLVQSTLKSYYVLELVCGIYFREQTCFKHMTQQEIFGLANNHLNFITWFIEVISLPTLVEDAYYRVAEPE